MWGAIRAFAPPPGQTEPDLIAPMNVDHDCRENVR